jgi:hypothetical protein
MFGNGYIVCLIEQDETADPKHFVAVLAPIGACYSIRRLDIPFQDN